MRKFTCIFRAKRGKAIDFVRVHGAKYPDEAFLAASTVKGDSYELITTVAGFPLTYTLRLGEVTAIELVGGQIHPYTED